MSPRWIERIIMSLTIGLIVSCISLIGCIARGQGFATNFEPELTFPINQGPFVINSNVIARISPPQPPIPPLHYVTNNIPLPSLLNVKVTRITNSEKEVITVIVQKPQDPPSLARKSWTNAFWVACTECDQEAIRKPTRIDLITSVPIEDGEQREYAIYFQCCGKEFKSRYIRNVTTPVAKPVQVPDGPR